MFACEIPDQVRIETFDQYELYLIDHYKELSEKTFLELGEKIYKWYHEFIDENYWYQDHSTLIDCLIQSDKFCYLKGGLKERITNNIMEDYIIGTDEAQKIFEGVNFYDLLYLIDNLYF